MLIDVIVFILLIVAIFKGLRKGLIVALFSFIGIVIGLAAAVKLSTAMAAYIGSNITVSQRWLPFIAFISVFIIVILLLRLAAKLLQAGVETAMLGWLNRIGGILLYTLIYFFIVSVLLFYAVQLHFIKPATVQQSVTYPFIQPFGPRLIDLIGSVFPFFRNMFEELLHFFEAVGDKKATA